MSVSNPSRYDIAAVTRALVLRNNRMVPPGSVESYAGSSAPTGWVMCDGSTLSRTNYYYLYSVIGNTYGAGDGVNTFNVPDLRGRKVLGAGQGNGLTNRNLADIGGAETHTLTSNEMPVHNHGVTDPGHAHSYVNNTNDQDTDNAFATETAADQVDLNKTTSSNTTGISINNTGGGQAHNNMDPFFVLNYIIKF
jgi:microcystin-dependent protein